MTTKVCDICGQYIGKRIQTYMLPMRDNKSTRLVHPVEIDLCNDCAQNYIVKERCFNNGIEED